MVISLARIPAKLRSLLRFTTSISPKRKTSAQVLLLHDTPIGYVSREYLSFSIDISVLVGGSWWEGAMKMQRGLGVVRIPPLQLSGKKLDIITKALAPAYVRIGGSESDSIYYFEAPDADGDSLVLTKPQWDNLHRYVQRNQLKLVFTAKYGLVKRKEHGLWCADELDKLLQYSQSQGYTIDVLELGNELNAYWAFHGLMSQPRAANLAIDYQRFAMIVKMYFPKVKVIAPGCAFWPRLGETVKPFSNITQRFLQLSSEAGTPLDIINWHYYPFQSQRSLIRTRSANTRTMLSPRAFNDFSKYSHSLRKWRDAYYPDTCLWTGETGSAQCGGEPEFSDRFISCFWWADQLGQGAVCGQQVMIRQSLVGGEYGLVDRLSLKLRPDFWLSWLWKQLMGTEVYAVKSNHHMLRCYCHSTQDGSNKTLLLINLSRRSISVDTALSGNVLKQYCLSAKSLHSKRIRVNGEKARYKKGHFSLDDFPDRPLSYELLGHSINFWVYSEN